MTIESDWIVLPLVILEHMQVQKIINTHKLSPIIQNSPTCVGGNSTSEQLAWTKLFL